MVADNELLNSLNVANYGDITFLLGAGCSVSSGCMNASRLVYEFKKRLYCTKLGIRLNRDTLIDDDKLNQLIAKDYRCNPSINEYSYYFEKCFPDVFDRNQFIKNEFHNRKPSFGYLCFANYLMSKKISYVLTTNFDQLIERAVSKIDEQYDYVVMSENEKPYLSSQLKIVKLHGDYNYDRIKNTENELAEIPEQLQRQLLDVYSKKIIVIGYSGQDQSIMSFLDTYLKKHSDSQLIWCGMDELHSNTKVNELLSINPASKYITISGFDSLFEKYYQVFGPANKQLDAMYADNKNNAFDLMCTNQPETFMYNVFPLIGTAKVYKINGIVDFDNDEVFFSHKCKGNTYVICDQPAINIINKKYHVSVSLCELNEEPINLNNKCKLIKEIVKWHSFKHGISIYRNNLYINSDAEIKEGLKISLDFIDNSICLVTNPNFFICEEVLSDSQNYAINSKKSGLYLKQNWNLLGKQIKDVFPNNMVFEDGVIGVKFSSNNFLEKRIGSIYECIKEPVMVGNTLESVNQLKILDSGGPKTTLFSSEEIHVGVFCCEEDKATLKSFLDLVEKGDSGYGIGIIPKYRGFYNTFKKKIVFEYDALPSIPINALLNTPLDEIVSFYMRGLDILYKKKQVDIALIYVSEKLKWIRTDGDFDFHNKIKLLSANKYKTQFLEEKTLRSRDNSSKILLNFAIGIYTKTIGMPWYPKDYAKDALFLGICFGKDSKGITVGCSQMFDGAGRGMQLIISQISDKKRDNQYLNKEEAFELGKKIRQTYYKSSKTNALENIVIHRCDPFRKEEIEGFKMAFEGINNFVLLQIVEDTSFNIYPYKNNAVCGYPAKRGTVIKTSTDTAYVWTDGSVVDADVDNGRTYRNSKRGIGRPLKIKKCYGNISINDAVKDLMYLTKMDFNCSDVLYSKLPVTIKYSRIVCDIIKQGNFDDDLISFEYVM